MSEEGDIAIAILRMDRLLMNITNKLRDSFKKFAVQNLPLIQEFIRLMELLRDSVISQMKRTPQVEHMHVMNLRNCQTKIAETSLELETLQEIFDEQKLKYEIFLKDIVGCINDDEESIKNIKETSQMEISREIEKSMSKILIIKEQGIERKKLLQSEIDSAKHKLDNSIEFNATTEKKLFDICAKVEQEYKDLFAKYDRDIGALYELTETLSKNRDVIKTESNIIKERLTTQRTLYIQFKQQREIAAMKIFNAKLELFRRNRAARIIQRIWKIYFQRISLKRRRRTKRKLN